MLSTSAFQEVRQEIQLLKTDQHVSRRSLRKLANSCVPSQHINVFWDALFEQTLSLSCVTTSSHDNSSCFETSQRAVSDPSTTAIPSLSAVSEPVNNNRTLSKHSDMTWKALYEQLLCVPTTCAPSLWAVSEPFNDNYTVPKHSDMT